MHENDYYNNIIILYNLDKKTPLHVSFIIINDIVLQKLVIVHCIVSDTVAIKG